MSLSNIKKFLNRYFIFIFLFIVLLVTILIYVLLPTNIAITVYISIFAIAIILRIIVEILSKSNQIKIKIKDKKNTIIKLYKIFDLENTNTIVAINTKDEIILSRAKKLFPGSRETKRKDEYSILLPKVTLKTIKLFLRDNDPERIIIHQFNYHTIDKPNSVKHSLSICIDNELIIKYNKKQFTKEEIKKIKEELNN